MIWLFTKVAGKHDLALIKYLLRFRGVYKIVDNLPVVDHNYLS